MISTVYIAKITLFQDSPTYVPVFAPDIDTAYNAVRKKYEGIHLDELKIEEPISHTILET